MILTPLMVKVGDQLASRIKAVPEASETAPAADLERHVVVVGFDEVGQLISLMLTKANIPYVAFDRDISLVRLGKQAGAPVYFGDMYSPVAQQAAGLDKAAAVYVSTRVIEDAKALAVTLHRLYPLLDVYVRVRSLRDQDELVAKGIKHALTGYIESTLATGIKLLEGVGVSEADIGELVKDFQKDNYALIRAVYAKVAKT